MGAADSAQAQAFPICAGLPGYLPLVQEIRNRNAQGRPNSQSPAYRSFARGSNFALQPKVAKKLGRKMAKYMGFVGTRDLQDILDANLYRWRKGEISGEEFGAPEDCCPI
jgi:hypothetical protein